MSDMEMVLAPCKRARLADTRRLSEVLLENGAEAKMSGSMGHKSSGAGIDQWSAYRNYCLRPAMPEGHLGTVRCSIEKGANISIKGKTALLSTSGDLGYSLLCSACQRSHFVVACLLVKEYGINPDGASIPAQARRFSMLIRLITGNEKLVQVLLSLGASKVDATKSCLPHAFTAGELRLGRS